MKWNAKKGRQEGVGEWMEEYPHSGSEWGNGIGVSQGKLGNGITLGTQIKKLSKKRKEKKKSSSSSEISIFNVSIPAVIFSSVRTANTNQQQWQEPGETDWPPLNWHESEGWTRTFTDTRSSLLCFSKWSEDHPRPTNCGKASYASWLSLSIDSWLHSLQTSHVLTWVLTQQNTM